MSFIDVRRIKPVGEFGSREWCEACASYGVRILESGDMPLDLCWGFSEVYTCPPERLISLSGLDRAIISWWRTVLCRVVRKFQRDASTPGFHVSDRLGFRL